MKRISLVVLGALIVALVLMLSCGGKTTTTTTTTRGPVPRSDSDLTQYQIIGAQAYEDGNFIRFVVDPEPSDFTLQNGESRNFTVSAYMKVWVESKQAYQEFEVTTLEVGTVDKPLVEFRTTMGGRPLPQDGYTFTLRHDDLPPGASQDLTLSATVDAANLAIYVAELNGISTEGSPQFVEIITTTTTVTEGWGWAEFLEGVVAGYLILEICPTASVTVTVNREGEGITPPVTNQSPVAELAVSPVNGIAPLSVVLNASDSYDPDGSITKYEWDFDGDGTYDSDGTDPTESHSYAVGTYVPRVRVTDNDGATDIAVVPVFITVTEPTVQNQLPMVTLSADPTGGQAPLLVEFLADASDPDGVIVNFEWNYDEGTGWHPGMDALDEQAIATVMYQAPGTYHPRVRVTDNDGATATATVAIIVTESGDVTYSLFVAGTDGPLVENGILTVVEGTSKVLDIWQLKGSDGSTTVNLGRSDIQIDTQLPVWVFQDFVSRGEIATVLWFNPEDPDPDDPGNMFIEPGTYGVGMAVGYSGITYARNWLLTVTDRPDFP